MRPSEPAAASAAEDRQAPVRARLRVLPGGVRLDPAEVAAADARLAGAHPREAVAWALGRFEPERVVIVTAMQATGVAIADLAIAVAPAVRIVTVDSGMLPEETHRYRVVLEERFGRPIEVLRPDAAAVAAFDAGSGPEPYRRSMDLRVACCAVRKVAPLDGLLAGVDCWLTGLRRDQSANRAGCGVVELDPSHGGIVKVNPLATWTEAQTHAHLRERGLPLHPLYALGYRSIGCAPCTRATPPGGDERSGRWWWEQDSVKECGIHGNPRRPARR